MRTRRGRSNKPNGGICFPCADVSRTKWRPFPARSAAPCPTVRRGDITMRYRPSSCNISDTIIHHPAASMLTILATDGSFLSTNSISPKQRRLRASSTSTQSPYRLRLDRRRVTPERLHALVSRQFRVVYPIQCRRHRLDCRKGMGRNDDEAGLLCLQTRHISTSNNEIERQTCPNEPRQTLAACLPPRLSRQHHQRGHPHVSPVSDRIVVLSTGEHRI